jgi:hypothetical protein
MSMTIDDASAHVQKPFEIRERTADKPTKVVARCALSSASAASMNVDDSGRASPSMTKIRMSATATPASKPSPARAE